MRGGTSNLRAMLEPAVQALGFELVDVEHAGSGRQAVLRVYIDSPDGITVDDCARVSHQVSAILDVEDPIPGQYMLEVSSPGLDRPLIKPEDFQRFAGEIVKIRTSQPVLGRRNFTGRLVGMQGETVILEMDKESFDLPFGDIEKARLVPQFK
jgi:ribosome maturation factor RimP